MAEEKTPEEMAMEYLQENAAGSFLDDFRRDENNEVLFNGDEKTYINTDAIKVFEIDCSDITDPEIFVITDLHAGATESETEKARRTIEMVKRNPRAKLIILGDMTDSNTIGSVGNPFAQDKSPRDAFEFVKELLREVDEQGKIVANVAGNHDHSRPVRTIGTSLVPEYIKEKALFIPAMGVLQFKLKSKADPIKTVNYNVLVQHGDFAKSGALGTMGSGFKAIENYGATIHSILLGHTHQNGFGTEVFFAPEKGTNKNYKNIVTAHAMPAGLSFQEYAIKAGYRPSNTDNSVIIVEQKEDKNVKGRMFFKPFSVSLDLLYAIENSIRTNHKKSLDDFSKGLNLAFGGYKGAITQYINKLNVNSSKKKIDETHTNIYDLYRTQIANLCEVEKNIKCLMTNFEENMDRFTIVKAKIPTALDRDKDVASPTNSGDKFDVVNVKLADEQTHVDMFVIGDVNINSETKFKKDVERLRRDVATAATNSSALVIIAGNLFKFDDEIFGFKKGGSVKEAFERIVKDSEELKQETDDDVEFNSIPYRRFAKMPESEQFAYYKRLIKSKEYKDGDYKDFDSKIKYAIQKIAYEPYTQALADILAPIKDRIVIMNEGNEEQKIENFRQYNPMQQLAERLGIPKTAVDSRFYQLNIETKNFLTDGNKQILKILGTHGPKKANVPDSLQTRINMMYRQFPGIDVNIITGYKRNAIFKENMFYMGDDGTLYMKKRTFVSVAGYTKVIQPNNVHLDSYIIERDQNRYKLVMTVHKDPAYISSDYIDKRTGRPIDFSEEFYKSLRPIESIKGIKFNRVIKDPFSVNVDMIPFRTKKNIIEETLENQTSSIKLMLKNELQIIKSLKDQASLVYRQAEARLPFKTDKRKQNPLLKVLGTVREPLVELTESSKEDLTSKTVPQL